MNTSQRLFHDKRHFILLPLSNQTRFSGREVYLTAFWLFFFLEGPSGPCQIARSTRTERRFAWLVAGTDFSRHCQVVHEKFYIASPKKWERSSTSSHVLFLFMIVEQLFQRASHAPNVEDCFVIHKPSLNDRWPEADGGYRFLKKMQVE